MQKVGVSKAKLHFSSLLNQIEKGESIVITKHGYAIVKMIPVNMKSNETVRAAIQQIKELRKGSTLSKINWKNLRDQGRR